jgi:serine/threonine-protein kinase
MMGTPAYMAPEQVLGQDIDARTDLYATGVVLYHLTTGRLPFKGDTPLEMAQSRINDTPTPARSVRDDLPAWLAQVLDISLAREPERRFQTALLFREALRRGLANLPIETPAPSAPPPELIATAAPRSLPIATAEPLPVAAQIPRTTPPPAAEMPTMATSRPAPPAAATSAKRADASRWNTNTLVVAGMAALVVIVIAASWMHRRSASSTPADAAAQTTAADPASAAPPSTAGTSSQPPDAPATTAATSDSSATPPSSPESTSAAVVPVSATPASSTPSSSAPAGAAPLAPAPGAASTDGRATAPPAASRGAARGRGRGTVADTPVAFSDLRALVVTGRKAEEESAVLRFEGGAITLTADKGGRVYSRLPYGELTSAAFVRAKNPRWYPTLAGPPSNVDMPGGLFRSSRGWLALQSRNSYLIVRLNDDTLRRVLDTVTERTGVKIEQLPSQ